MAFKNSISHPLMSLLLSWTFASAASSAAAATGHEQSGEAVFTKGRESFLLGTADPWLHDNAAGLESVAHTSGHGAANEQAHAHLAQNIHPAMQAETAENARPFPLPPGTIPGMDLYAFRRVPECGQALAATGETDATTLTSTVRREQGGCFRDRRLHG